MAAVSFDTVLINGSVGTGKTTTAEELGAELEQRDIPGAVIDVDWLCQSWPAPPDDPFQTTLALANTQAVASNFRRAGARVLVVATVIETLDALRRTATALGSKSLLHVRLTATHEVVVSRLVKRHDNDDVALQWHTQRHPELSRILDLAGFTGELLIDTTQKPVSDVVKEIAASIIK
jgi:adenylate kinase family enzyme